MTDKVTLLPCPFCGGAAKLTDHEDCDVGGRWVVCTPCGAARWGDQPDEAITAWNARTNTNTELVEALRRIIERSHNDEIGTAKVIDMREIADKALSLYAGDER